MVSFSHLWTCPQGSLTLTLWIPWLHRTESLQVLQPIVWPTTSDTLGLCPPILVDHLLRDIPPHPQFVLSSLKTRLSLCPCSSQSLSFHPALSSLPPPLPSLICLSFLLGQCLWLCSWVTMVSNYPFMNPISMSTRGQQAQVLLQGKTWETVGLLSRPSGVQAPALLPHPEVQIQPPPSNPEGRNPASSLRPTVPFRSSPPPSSSPSRQPLTDSGINGNFSWGTDRH